ncbi:ADP-ribosylation factor family protein [uncultured archaeon]|nr:ADP-ribosylation factor family protein [uncultured archaeon]
MDATVPSSFGRAKEMLSLVGKEALPYVIAANKQDAANAMRPAEIKRAMGLPEGVQVIGTSAVLGDGCMDAVKALIETIVRRGSAKGAAGKD